jgi:hypothetical protein
MGVELLLGLVVTVIKLVFDSFLLFCEFLLDFRVDVLVLLYDLVDHFNSFLESEDSFLGPLNLEDQFLVLCQFLGL